MKKLEQLGISPAPWKVKQDSGYDRESGDFNTYDAVCDAEGKVMVEWANGESYGEVWPNSEQDASLIAAAPKLYARLYEAWSRVCFAPSKKCKDCSYNGLFCSKWRAALDEASGEGLEMGSKNALSDLALKRFDAGDKKTGEATLTGEATF